MRHALHTLYKSSAEKVIPTRTVSAFKDKGVLTPEEFVAAGDYLVRACPTWSWEAGDPARTRTYLPKDKQYLVTRNVPCYKRASTVELYGSKGEDLVECDAEGDGWVATHEVSKGGAHDLAEEHIPSMSEQRAGGAAGAAEEDEHDDDVPDIDALDIDDAENDEATLPAAAGYLRADEPEDAILRTRAYDLLVSYDKYYAVPRFWLVGYDEARQPLRPDQILEDVSEEHARKTITVDEFPHIPKLSTASIHPCKHGNVMKQLSARLEDAGKEFRVDLYMVLFLKFIASVVPTIEYDHTMTAGL